MTIDHLIDRSDAGAWARFLAQRDGTRFITQPGEDGIERQLPDQNTDERDVAIPGSVIHD